MTRRRERGSVVLYFTVAFVLSVAVGVGVYLLLRDRAREKAAIEVIEEQRAPVPRAPEPVPVTPVVAEAPVAPPPEVASPLEVAAREARPAARESTGVAIGAPGVSGDLEKTVVSGVLTAQKARLQRCITADSPPMRAAMRVRLVIDARGKVALAAALDSKVDAAFTRCVLDKLRRTAFPPAAGATTLVIPIDVRYDG